MNEPIPGVTAPAAVVAQDPEIYSDGRLSAPAALRNRDAIATVLAEIAPETGRALEIASGSGEHVIRFAPTMPGLVWQPSDPDAEKRRSIVAWSEVEPSPTIQRPIDLDACTPGWATKTNGFDLIFLANLLHLVDDTQAQTCLSEMTRAIAPGGMLAVYGPFLRDGQTTSDGDTAFDARLRADEPGAGYKDVAFVHAIWEAAGLSMAQPRLMPANNLMLCARHPSDQAVT